MPRVIGIAAEDALANTYVEVLTAGRHDRVGHYMAAESLKRSQFVVELYRYAGGIRGATLEEINAFHSVSANDEAPPIKFAPDDHLRNLAGLFMRKNADYGASHEIAGDVLAALFPTGVTLNGPRAMLRFALLTRIVDKLTRYTRNFDKPQGHPDSLDDLAVFAAMLRTIDDTV